MTIGDTGQLPSGGGVLEAEVNGTNVHDFLLIDLARAITSGQGNEALSEVSIEEFTARVITTNDVVTTISFESLQVEARAECGTNGPSVSGTTRITGLRINGQEVNVTGEVNQRIDYQGGHVIVNALSSRVEGSYGEVTVIGLYIRDDSCMEGPIGLAHADIDCESTTTPPPTDCFKITGSGAIYGTPSGDKGAFCLSASKRDGGLWGRLQYLDYDTCTWVRSTCINSITRIDECTYVIEYKIRINGQDGTARVEVSDYSKSGKRDLFKIELSNGYEAAGTLCRGNIKIRKCRDNCSRRCDGDDNHGDDDDDDHSGHDDDDD